MGGQELEVHCIYCSSTKPVDKVLGFRWQNGDGMQAQAKKVIEIPLVVKEYYYCPSMTDRDNRIM